MNERTLVGNPERGRAERLASIQLQVDEIADDVDILSDQVKQNTAPKSALERTVLFQQKIAAVLAAIDAYGVNTDTRRLVVQLERQYNAVVGMAAVLLTSSTNSEPAIVRVDNPPVGRPLAADIPARPLARRVIVRRPAAVEPPVVVNPPRSERAEEILSRTDAIKKINELYEVLRDNFKAEVNSTTANAVTPISREMIKIAQEHLTPKEVQLMKDMFELRDASNTQTGPDSSDYLAWAETNPAAQARVHAQVFCKENTQKRVLHDYKDLIVVTPDGREERFNLSEVFEEVEDYLSGPYPYDPTDPSKTYNYAALGNPDANSVARGVPTIEKLIEKKFPNIKYLPKYMMDIVINFIIVAEMRSAFYVPAYAGYQGSPIPGFDGSPAEDCSPMAACVYKAQANASFPKHRMMAMFTRFADPEHPQWAEYIRKFRLGGKLEVTGEAPRRISTSHVNTFGQKEAVIGRLRKPENVQEFIRMRDRYTAIVSPSDLPGTIQLRPDMMLKPGWFHWLKGEWPGSREKLGELSYHNFYVLESAFNTFEKFVDSEYSPPTSMMDVQMKIESLIHMVRDFKTYFDGNNPILKDDENIFVSTVQLMMIIFLKKMYRTYKVLRTGEAKVRGVGRLIYKDERQTNLQSFAELAEQLIMPSGTLPDLIKLRGKFPLETVFKTLRGNRIKTELTAIGTFFNDDVEESSQGFAMKIEQLVGREEARKYARWLRTPDKTEKDNGH